VVGGIFAVPKALSVMKGAASGQGIQGAVGTSGVTPALPSALPALAQASSPVPSPLLVTGPLAPVLPVVQAKYAGCILVADRCGCFDMQGAKVEADSKVCRESAGVNGTPKAIVQDSEKPHGPDAAEIETLVFSLGRAKQMPSTDKQYTSLSQVRF